MAVGLHDGPRCGKLPYSALRSDVDAFQHAGEPRWLPGGLQTKNIWAKHVMKGPIVSPYIQGCYYGSIGTEGYML